MKRSRRWRHGLEVGVVAAGASIAPYLPRPALLRLAAGLSRVAYRLDVRSRRIAHANLRAVFPEVDPAIAERVLIRQAYYTFALTSLDLFWFARRTAERLRRWVSFDSSFDAYLQQAPVIAVCAHFGNWEVMGQAAALAGAPSVSVATPLRNPPIDRRITRLRTLTGQRIISRDGAARGLLRALRGGQRVALLLDQNTRLNEGGVWTPFFGLPVPVSGIVDLLARRTGAPVCAVYGYQRADGGYRCEAGPLLTASVDAAAGQPLAAVLLADLECRIRRHPGQWLWMYKRWKYMAPGVPAARYPFYAHGVRPD